MKYDRAPESVASAVTLVNVLDRVGSNTGLSDTRKRDLRSAIVTYGKIVGQPLPAIALDLAMIRRTLDGIVPLQAKVSRKRWANLRSDIAAAIAASGLQPMLKTSAIALDKEWATLLAAANDKGISNGLTRLARWASLRKLAPAAVDTDTLERFFSELESSSLVRNLRFQRRNVAKLWNRLVARLSQRDLHVVAVPEKSTTSDRIPWSRLSAGFRQDAEDYLHWCAVPDPLDENARGRALAPETLRLRRHHIHTAANAACSAGMAIQDLTALAGLVEPATFRAILRQQWERHGRKITPHLLDLASVLTILASEWGKVSPEQLVELKKSRSKLGTLPSGLTEKNRALLRRFEDPQLLVRLLNLPDQLWRLARRNLSVSKRWFIDLQTALAIDVLLHVPLRIENLGSLRFDEHLHWPRGRAKPALISIREQETKNEQRVEYELPTFLSDRLYVFHNEIAPSVIGRRPDVLFVSMKGAPRSLSTIRVAIQRTILRRIGIKMSPHQFRHLGAKIHLDTYHGAHESVRQLLAHKTLRTTTRFYAGQDTRRAGRAHAELIRKLREPRLARAENPFATKN